MKGRWKLGLASAVAVAAMVAAPAAQASTPSTGPSPASSASGPSMLMPNVAGAGAKPAYSNLYNYYLRTQCCSVNIYASSYWLYSGYPATAWNLAYIGTVTGGSTHWPYSNGGIDDNQAGLATYRIFDEASGNCWGLNGQTIEETNACTTANTEWVATPAPDGFSGWFGLENVGNTNLKDGYMTAQTWGDGNKMSVNYQGSGNTTGTEEQSFHLVTP